jgi:hypothetical protein
MGDVEESSRDTSLLLAESNKIIVRLQDRVTSLEKLNEKYCRGINSAIGGLRHARRTGEVQKVIDQLEALL